MAGEQTREEVAARLEAIFSSAMEGEELDKALVSIDKRLDKFEGKGRTDQVGRAEVRNTR